MYPTTHHIDDRIDTLDTHGWALNSQGNTLKAWRYTPQGKETLTIDALHNDDRDADDEHPTITVTVAGTTKLETTLDNAFDALDRAEHYMASNPSSTAPNPSRPPTPTASD